LKELEELEIIIEHPPRYTLIKNSDNFVFIENLPIGIKNIKITNGFIDVKTKIPWGTTVLNC
jgi:hypothetical protein